MSSIGLYAKSIVGALVAGLTALSTALLDGDVETAEWLTVAVAFLGTLAGVWAVPNALTSHAPALTHEQDARPRRRASDTPTEPLTGLTDVTDRPKPTFPGGGF